MFPLPLRYYIYIGLVLFGLAGFGYGKYKSYKLDAFIVAQEKLAKEKEEQYQELVIVLLSFDCIVLFITGI